MARRIVMPSLGMYTAEGTVVRWLKPSGATVAAGEPVLELETEKALADVTAPEAGILYHVVQPGAIVQVESLLGFVLAPGESAPDDKKETLSEVRHEPPVERAVSDAAGLKGGASPNARRVAAELDVDLSNLEGSGPGGRITEADVRAAADAEA
jgi:pyruvate/2-oxoglutarate dehydrogenase complex dihydrolipoamide acyltransferase (E2) component